MPVLLTRLRTIPLYVFFSFLLFCASTTLASAATYYVAKTGNDGNSCAMAQNQATPKKTINVGIKCLASGSTLVIRGGTYPERFDASVIPPSGTAGAPTTIKAASGETVTIRPSGSGNIFRIAKRSYLTVDGLTIDGANITSGQALSIGDDSHYIRIQNGVIKNILNAGSCVSTHTLANPSSNIQFVNNEVFNCRNPLLYAQDPSNGGAAHCIYLRATANLIEGNFIHECEGYGIASRSCNVTGGCITRNSIIRNNRVSKSVGRGIHIEGEDALVYNNVLFNNDYNPQPDPDVTSSVAGIYVALGSVNRAKLYNNTIYNTNGNCMWIRQGSGHIARNNICWQNTNNTIFDQTNATLSNNLFVNPLFVNAAGGDFCLQANSPAQGKGADCTTVGPNNGTVTFPGDTTPTPTPSTGTPCYTITSPQLAPAGFGVPYSAITSTHELLITAGCQGNDINVIVGNAQSPLLTYAWPTIHYWLGSTRKTAQLTCAESVSGWCRKEGNATITADQNETWLIGYACQWDGSRWWCGCRTSQCAAQNATGSLWQAQLIKKP